MHAIHFKCKSQPKGKHYEYQTKHNRNQIGG